MDRIRSASVCSLGCFLVDFTRAFALFRFAAASADWPLAVLLYIFFAFAGQMPLGLLAGVLPLAELGRRT